MCPYRFYEDGQIFDWIGDVMLGHSSPLVVEQVGFLERESGSVSGKKSRGDVGKIDHVLIVPGTHPLRWCALEVQAVYFSGAARKAEFMVIAQSTSDDIPYPDAIRRPDYRSSGAKRLMPQLQTKVPSLRRWGKKTAVLVDESFFNALGHMDSVNDVSNCDIAWFVVEYKDDGERVQLKPKEHVFTTLERSVEGLTAGRPVSLEAFERSLMKKSPVDPLTVDLG
jgi:hypothetical protein